MLITTETNVNTKITVGRAAINPFQITIAVGIDANFIVVSIGALSFILSNIFSN
jgi:hypothetical protein